MKLILRIASLYAIYDELEFTIYDRHIIQALETVSISKKLERTIIYNVFEYIKEDADKECPYIYDENLSKKGTFYYADCSQEVLDKLTQLRDFGIDLFEEDIYFLRQLNDNYFEKGKVSLKSHTNSLLTPLNHDNYIEIMNTKKNAFQTLKSIVQLKEKLKETIYNQEDAIESVCDSLVKLKHIKNSSKPDAIFLFLGGSGTGKTFFAETLVENLYEYPKHFFVNMSQYINKESGGQLYGSARMWSNAKTGDLTEFVRKNPKSIIVFDEFEKSHKNVQNVFLNILEAGYIDDLCGWCSDGEMWTSNKQENEECKDANIHTRVDFSQTILIFTSNLGSKVYSNEKLLESMQDSPQQLKEMLFKTLSKDDSKVSISTPILSRLKQGKVVLFNSLGYKELYNLNSTISKQYKSHKLVI